MLDRLAGKVALVTGAASGMGAEHARAIVAEGGKVVIADEAAEALADELGMSAVAVHLDVVDAAQWEAAVTLAEETFGALNVLVNNAGVIQYDPLTEISDELWDRVMGINAKGAFIGMRAAMPALQRSAPSSVVNVSSYAGLQGVPQMAAYTASKFAVCGLTKAVALEVLDSGVRVNSVHPGAVRTAMYASAEGESGGPTRAADPAEIATLIVYLASDESSFSTGAEFVADGGLSAGIR